ncbi:MAG TPA: ABC transporter permease [Gemmatimonadaceae bacterium]|nr:ABC transporter permease [Gemmatimonadaceae bacterium]
MSKLEMAIAWRYLRSRRGSKLLSFISIVAIGGVIVGVSALIVITGVMNGLQQDLRDKILVASPDVRVLTYGDDLKIDMWEGVLAKAKDVPGVVAAAPFVLSEGLISAGHNWVEAAQVVGIEPAGRGVPEVTRIRQHALPGGDFRFASTGGDRRGIVLGKLLSDRLNAYPGDTVRMIAPPPAGKLQMNVLGTSFTPRFYEFEVTGTFETGMYEYDDRYVYLPLSVAQEFAGLGNAVSGLEVKTADRWTADAVARALTEKLGFPYRTVDWKEQNRTLFQALKLEKLGMAFITLLIAIVAAFNIVSTLTMVVVDKTREIGILKAMGMSARSIRRIFFAQGLVIGVVGTGIGLTLGVIGAWGLDRYKWIRLDPSVYFIDHLPASMQLFDVALIVGASLLIAAAATLHPARQAARLFPVEAIRHD